MDWAEHAATWPHAEHSDFVQARPHRWHVQSFGRTDAPTLLLLHGAGGATHSWRELAPLLAQDYRVIAPDLPGHGFTRLGALQRSGIDLMAADMATLLAKLGVRPDALIGHSAGGALALRMAQLAETPPKAVIGLNAALDNFAGPAGWLFPMMAKALALNPFAAPTLARMASGSSIDRLIDSTGSTLDAAGLALYRACIADPRHVDGTLTMMSQWRLDALRRALRATPVPTLLLAGARDKTVPPATSIRAADAMPEGRATVLDDLGHLAHEEAPEEIATRIGEFLDARL